MEDRQYYMAVAGIGVVVLLLVLAFVVGRCSTAQGPPPGEQVEKPSAGEREDEQQEELHPSEISIGIRRIESPDTLLVSELTADKLQDEGYDAGVTSNGEDVMVQWVDSKDNRELMRDQIEDYERIDEEKYELLPPLTSIPREYNLYSTEEVMASYGIQTTDDVVEKASQLRINARLWPSGDASPPVTRLGEAMPPDRSFAEISREHGIHPLTNKYVDVTVGHTYDGTFDEPEAATVVALPDPSDYVEEGTTYPQLVVSKELIELDPDIKEILMEWNEDLELRHVQEIAY